MLNQTVIYHPSISHYLRFIATTAGRDKLFGTLQYLARLYVWYLLRAKSAKTSIAPFAALQGQLAFLRKGLRLGKNVEHFKAAAVAMEVRAKSSIGGELLRYCAIGRQLGYAGFLTLDALTFLDTAGIRPLASAKRLQREAQRAWFAALTFSAVAGFYNLWQLRQQESELDTKEGEGVIAKKKLEKEKQILNTQLISDLCDMTIPCTALGLANFNDGVVGLAGTISSVLGVMTIWQKTA